MKNLNQNETKGETSRLGVEPVATSQSGLAKLGKAETQVELESAAQAAPLATGKAAQAALKSRRHILLRLGPYSLRLGVRSLVVALALLVVLTVVAVASVSTGAYPVSPAQVSAAIFGYGQEDNYARYFVTQVRAPRIATAMLVGAALGLSGALFQAVSGNPLGSPDIIGFTTGAATGALVAIILVGASPLGVSLGAIAGGVGAAALVYVLAWKNGITGNRLVLVGIGLAAVEHALNKLLIVRAPLANAQQAAQWQAGSLNDANWAWLAWLALALVVLTPALACLTRPLSTLALGDELAHGLGTRVQATRSGALAVGVTLVALATAVTGPIAFVALAAPHLARRASGAPGVNLTNSGLMGATLVVVADFVAQRALAPTQLAVGVVTATLGGLYLVLFLVLQWRKGI